VKALIKENVPLGPLTTFGIGGPAQYFVEATTEEGVRDSIQFSKSKQLRVFILGGGSNVLVADAGFRGVVIKVAIPGIEWKSEGGNAIVSAGAGEDWDAFVSFCVDRDLAGIECLSGIPGSVGGTPVQNVGAYGQEVSDVLLEVQAYDRKTESIVNLSRKDCGFSYRTSIFNTTARDQYIVLRVQYSLIEHGAAAVRYPDLEREFAGSSGKPTLADVRSAVRRIRARKAMLIVEGDPDCRSAGSFFKNPIMSAEEFEDLQARAGVELPQWPAGDGRVKTSAARLIEHAGFLKGYSLGRAAISSKHTLALVNTGGAGSADILRLADEIRGRVKERFGVTLFPEPVFVGANSSPPEWAGPGLLQ
jgi:UDP-N-acetylmuramate dehydrogenase